MRRESTDANARASLDDERRNRSTRGSDRSRTFVQRRVHGASRLREITGARPEKAGVLVSPPPPRVAAIESLSKGRLRNMTEFRTLIMTLCQSVLDHAGDTISFYCYTCSFVLSPRVTRESASEEEQIFAGDVRNIRRHGKTIRNINLDRSSAKLKTVCKLMD